VKTILGWSGLHNCYVMLAATLALMLLGTRTLAELSQTCDRAATQVSHELNVPLDVLHAITRVETGRKKDGQFQSWPWTVNMEGADHWFDTENEAKAYVFNNFKQGARNFSVGCFQINYKRHAQNFNSIEDMFDPVKNAQYAAKFLSNLHGDLGNWSDAAAAYHSRTPKFAKIYKARFDSIYQNLSSLKAAADPGVPNRKGSTFLSEATRPGALGSLVPLGKSGQPSLFNSGGGENG
jgi:hypothetical protein